eukprot:CAMPEP_0117575996 /NCGR_PEP_ID=MMETSP0784-20121206/62540_1 /TAXON_ID=39447 /ORGANISM="" /LENGTH=202 /DNA_ID=CAMNT_0005375175 /DNA_START=38 /DNA_END=646 /DNA_ORIENTATION=+
MPRVATSTKLSMSTEGFSASVPFLKKPKNLDGMIGSADEFDPFGFCEMFDPKWMRESELKHGRVAMLAVVGWLAQSAGFHLPGPEGVYDNANPIDAVFSVGPSPMLQIFFGLGILEWFNHDGKISMNDMHTDSTREVGQFSNPMYGAKQLKGKSEAEINDLKLKELRNGRLAMFAIGGLVHHQIVTGTEVFGDFPNTALWGL